MGELPTTFLYTTPPRGDCAVDCPRLNADAEAQRSQWIAACDLQTVGQASDEDIENGFLALKNLNQLMLDAWDCPGRMDLALGDKTTPCRHPNFQPETEQ